MGAGSGLAEAIDETALLRADRCRDTIYATGSSTVKATV